MEAAGQTEPTASSPDGSGGGPGGSGGGNGGPDGDGGKRERAPIDGPLLRAAAERFDGTLETTLRASVIPYGYTVTIWASGAYLIKLQGPPTIWEAFAFVSGAILAFGVLASLATRLPHRRGSKEAPRLHPEPARPLLAAGLHIVAVGLALASATAVDLVFGDFAWLLASFAATTIYLAAASAELAIAVELQRREFSLSVSRAVRAPKRAVRRIRSR